MSVKLFLLLCGAAGDGHCIIPPTDASIPSSAQSWECVSPKAGSCAGTIGLRSPAWGGLGTALHQWSLPLPITLRKASSSRQKPVCRSLGPGGSVNW